MGENLDKKKERTLELNLNYMIFFAYVKKKESIIIFY